MENSPTPPPPEQNIVADLHDDYKQTQVEIYHREVRRVRKNIFWIGALLLISDLLGLAMTDGLEPEAILYSCIFPVIYVSIGILAMKQPMLASILATLLFVGLIVLTIIIYGGVGAISGFIIKAVIIYLIFASFQSAKAAEQAKKEMR